MTIIELTVVMGLLLSVLSIFLGVLDSVNRGLVTQEERSRANDEVRAAVEQMDREIRSGNVLYDPAEETPIGHQFYTLRIYTQANATTRTPPLQCVQWRILGQRLNRRAWPAGHPEDETGWRTIAENVVNRELGVHAFTLDPDPAKGGRVINVVLLVDEDTTDTTTSPVRVQTALNGRNTTYNYATNVCDPSPPG